MCDDISTSIQKKQHNAIIPFMSEETPKSRIPEMLREIPQAPAQLYIRGTLPSHDTHYYLTIIGSRKFTPYGKDACETLIRNLAGYPIVIVSGLALGMDSIAHEAAIKYGLPTVAIPGSGLSDEVVYPRSNLQLAHRILMSGGALISEFEPNFKATNWSFPRRNRIMAGISHATLVIECDIESGTMITAKLAMDYNRDVLAVPGSIFSDASRGTNYLIRDGATPVVTAQHILEALHITPHSETLAAEENIEDLLSNNNERSIYALLRQPHDKHELIRKSGLKTFQATVVLSSLELKGLIKESGGEIRRV